MLRQITAIVAKRFAKTSCGLLRAAGIAPGQAPKASKPAHPFASQGSVGMRLIGTAKLAGGVMLTPSRIQQIPSHLPRGSSGVPIIEVRP
jgi:hypothetical protein